jgi:hypothetical protein
MSTKSIARSAAGVAAFGGAALLAYAGFVRPWHLRWGATPDEAGRPLPGDELVDNPRFVSTRAVTIHAPAEAVWPWLVLLGYGRGGFYSYDWVENLLMRVLRGTPGYRSAERILPAFQQLSPGDFIPAGPPDMLGGRVAETARWKVEAVIPGRSVVLRGWGAFVLEPLDAHTTRLIVRSHGTRLGSRLMQILFWEPAHFVMERRMLRGIRERAERRQNVSARSAAAAVPETTIRSRRGTGGPS